MGGNSSAIRFKWRFLTAYRIEKRHFRHCNGDNGIHHQSPMMIAMGDNGDGVLHYHHLRSIYCRQWQYIGRYCRHCQKRRSLKIFLMLLSIPRSEQTFEPTNPWNFTNPKNSMIIHSPQNIPILSPDSAWSYCLLSDQPTPQVWP